MNCIKNNIAVFSPHTSWDAVNGGVNDWLLSIFPVATKEVVLPTAEDAKVGAGRFATFSRPIELDTIIRNVKTHVEIPHLRLALAKDKKESELFAVIHSIIDYYCYFKRIRLNRLRYAPVQADRFSSTGHLRQICI